MPDSESNARAEWVLPVNQQQLAATLIGNSCRYIPIWHAQRGDYPETQWYLSYSECKAGIGDSGTQSPLQMFHFRVATKAGTHNAHQIVFVSTYGQWILEHTHINLYVTTLHLSNSY